MVELQHSVVEIPCLIDLIFNWKVLQLISPGGCFPVFCANESWMHQKSKGKCLGSMDSLRGITVSWRSESSNLSTWRVYFRLKILTRFDFFCFIRICQKSPFIPDLYRDQISMVTWYVLLHLQYSQFRRITFFSQRDRHVLTFFENGQFWEWYLRTLQSKLTFRF